MHDDAPKVQGSADTRPLARRPAAQTETRKALQLVLITFSGFKPNIWSEDPIDVALDATEIFGNLQA